MSSRCTRGRAPAAPRAVLVAVLVAALGLLLSGCGALAPAAPSATSPHGPHHTGPASPHPTGPGTALAALARLTVKGRAPMTGYDRAEFGPAWLDADRNGCDTRNDVLGSLLTDVVHEPGTHGCVVTSGDLLDPYTATSLHFVRGGDILVDVDHVVALGDAWATGAFRWPIRERAALANDPLNLLPVDASANRQKGDADAATWLPPAKAYRCAYVARQVTVKAKYALWVTAPERAAMERVLDRCPQQPLLQDSGAPLLVPVHVTDPATPASDGAGYPSCDAARAAGAAPLHRGEPGYDASLDGDGDGVACEG